jgi:hypothetical protein
VGKFPIGSLMNRGLTVKTGQPHMHTHLRLLLRRIETVRRPGLRRASADARQARAAG